MSSDDGFQRTGRRRAAIEAAKRIKMEADDANMSLSDDESENENESDENENDQFDEPKTVTPSADNKKQRMRGCKWNQVSDSTIALVSEAMRSLSKNVSKCSKANPSKCEDTSKKRRGRPPKPKSAKSSSTHKKNVKYKDPDITYDQEPNDDVNLRRESYNTSLVNKEHIVAKSIWDQKQLQVEDRDISYKESLMKFSKDLGPTARKVASRKLQSEGIIYQPARLWLDSLLTSPDTHPHPLFMGMNPFNSSVKNNTTTQVTQPLISFKDSESNANAKDKGKKIMVDDGKSNFNKWDVADNLELLFGKRKGGVKIGNDQSNNQEFVHKNLGYGNVGNRGTNSQTGSFFLNYNANSTQNINKISAMEDVNRKKEVSLNVSELEKLNSSVYPATYLPPSSNVSSTYLGLDSGARVAPSFAHGPPPVQPPQNWFPPPPATAKMNPVVNDDFWNDLELQLALDYNNMPMPDQESNVWSQNLWAPSQPHQFLQPGPVGQNQEQPPQGPQDTLLDLFTFNAQKDFGLQMGNNQQYPPPGGPGI